MIKFINSNFYKIINYGSNIIFNRFLGFILIILLARNFSQEDLGNYFIFINLQSILVTISMAGIPHLIIKECSFFDKNKRDHDKIFRVILFSLIFSFILILFLSIILYFFYYQKNLLFIVISSYLTILNSILFFLFIAFGKIIFANTFEQVIKYILIICILLFAFNFDFINQVKDIIFIYIGVNFIIFFLFFYKALWLLLKPLNKININSGDYKKYLNYTFFLGLAGLFGVLNSRVDMLMIDYLTNNKEFVSQYGVSTQFSLLLYLPIITTIHVLGPKISSLIKSKKFRILNFMLQIYRIIVFVFTLFALLIFYFYIDTVISFFINDQFEDAANLVLIIGVSYCLSSIISFNDIYLNYNNAEKKVTSIIFFTTLINISLNYILIPLYGVYGAAIALSISNFLMSLILMIVNNQNKFDFLFVIILINKRKFNLLKKIIY